MLPGRDVKEGFAVAEAVVGRLRVVRSEKGEPITVSAGVALNNTTGTVFQNNIYGNDPAANRAGGFAIHAAISCNTLVLAGENSR